MKYTYFGVSHTYNSRVSWALLELSRNTGEESYLEAAAKNLEYNLTNQNKFYWYRNCNFKRGQYPVTHLIAYTIRGFLESGILLKEKKFVNSAINAATALLKKFLEDRIIFSEYNNQWQARNNYICVTGCAQIALNWFRIFELTKKRMFYENAIKLLYFVKWMQQKWDNDIFIPNPLKANISGALPGSYPLWGDYMPFFFPNWAAKFFADALMLEEQLSLK